MGRALTRRTELRKAAGSVVGFPSPSFWSTDYFPLLPWFFLYCAGYFLWGLLDQSGRAKQLLLSTALPVSKIAEQTGFSGSSHLAAVFKAMTGQAPRDYRRRL